MSNLDDQPVRVFECCADPDNLEVEPQERPDLTVRVCQVCGRRHFEVVADPAVLGIEMS